MPIIMTTRLILAVGVIVSLGFIVYASPPHPSLWPLYLWFLYPALAAWVGSPYWFLFRKTRQSPRSEVFDRVILALAIGLAVSSSLFYYYAFFTELTAFSGMWFFLTPILQWGVLVLVRLWEKSGNAT